MDNKCPECKRRFSGDLRFCPYCRAEAAAPRTSAWRHEDSTLIRHDDPDEDDVRVCHRQNAFVLLCCAILLLPPYLLFVQDVYDQLVHGDWDWFLMVSFAYVTSIALMVFWAISLAWDGEGVLVQVTAAFLVIVTMSFVFPPMLLFAGILFSGVLGIASSGERSFRDMDPSYLPVLSGIALAVVICAYLWLLNSPMSIP